MDRRNEIDATAPITEQASAWWVLLNEGDASAADRRAFAEWAARSPERVSAFLQAAQLKQALASPDTVWPDTPVEELIRAAQASRHEVTRLDAAHREERGSGSTSRSSSGGFPASIGRLVAAAVAAVAVATLATGVYFYSRPERLETAVGEQRSVRLSDGSLVTLNTGSAVELRFGRDRRRVNLLSGEALFKVARDAARPFDVTAGETTVRAVGTQFNVDRRESATTVTVVEGKVAVFTTAAGTPENAKDTRLLEAGEQVTRSATQSGEVARADSGIATAWTERKLIFEERPLGEVAAEFNRYNRKVIEIQGEELRSQEVTGVFQADDPDSFLAFLARLPDVTVVKADESRFVVRSKSNRSKSKEGTR